LAPEHEAGALEGSADLPTGAAGWQLRHESALPSSICEGRTRRSSGLDLDELPAGFGWYWVASIPAIFDVQRYGFADVR
jgi:hypothetical protein